MNKKILVVALLFQLNGLTAVAEKKICSDQTEAKKGISRKIAAVDEANLCPDLKKTQRSTKKSVSQRGYYDVKF